MGCTTSFLHAGVTWTAEKETLVELDLSDKPLKEETRWTSRSLAKGHARSIIAMAFKVSNPRLPPGHNTVSHSPTTTKTCDCSKSHRN